MLKDGCTLCPGVSKSRAKNVTTISAHTCTWFAFVRFSFAILSMKNTVVNDSAQANAYHVIQIRRNKLLVTIGDGTILKKDGSIVRSPIGAEVQIWRLQDEEEGQFWSD